MTRSESAPVSETTNVANSQRLRIVVCHNYYQQRGGEDQVFEDEVDLLRSHGHHVVPFTRQSNDISGFVSLPTAAGAIWNRPAARDLAEVVEREDADIVHFHNWLPLISLAAPVAARAAGAATVQSLQNYRFACPKGTFFRDGGVCEDCLNTRTLWPAVQHGCYRESHRASAVVSAALVAHRARGTIANDIDAYVAASRFTATKLIEASLPQDRIFVKPNFLSRDPGVGHGSGGYAMFLGRLSPEKGISTLLEAWRSLPDPPLLKIAGTGPLEQDVLRAADQSSQVEYLGFASDDIVDRTMKDAAYLVLPSVNYEGFPKTIVEAFARGTPVVASRLGAMKDAIEAGITGEHFTAGDPVDLARVVNGLRADPSAATAMRAPARAAYLDRYTPERNYGIMMEVYESAMARRVESGEADT